MTGVVTSVSRSGERGVQKTSETSIRLLVGCGVEGDVHCGRTIRHLARMQRDPTQPNLRQVHLIDAAFHDELAARDLPVRPGEMGENVATRGIDLLALPTGALLRLGDSAVVEVTGLRNPCAQLDAIHPTLMAATLDRDTQGGLVRRAGIMSVVVADGEVRTGDSVHVELPSGPHVPLQPV